MKILDSKKFASEELDRRIEMSAVVGGMPPNKSDAEGGYTDTKGDCGTDTARESVLDIRKSQACVDTSTKEDISDFER